MMEDLFDSAGGGSGADSSLATLPTVLIERSACLGVIATPSASIGSDLSDLWQKIWIQWRLPGLQWHCPCCRCRFRLMVSHMIAMQVAPANGIVMQTATGITQLFLWESGFPEVVELGSAAV